MSGVPLADCEVAAESIHPSVRERMGWPFFLMQNRTPVWSEPLACCLRCRAEVRIPPATTVWDDWTLEQLVTHYRAEHSAILEAEYLAYLRRPFLTERIEWFE